MISGAGVLIITTLNKKLVFVLFEENSKYKNSSDLGGSRENYETSNETAMREAFEESAGLIFLNNKILKSSIIVKIKEYKSFCVKLSNLDNIIQHFSHNRQIMKKCADSTYNEMRRVRIFDLNTLLTASKNGQQNVLDITGQIRKIRGRTLNIINKLERHDIENLKATYLDITKLKLNNCFDGVYVYR